jgi:hypothetical protein
VPGSRESSAWLRGLQQHLGGWHDLETVPAPRCPEGRSVRMLGRVRMYRSRKIGWLPCMAR